MPVDTEEHICSMNIHHVENDKFLFLLNDLTAANWVSSIDIYRSDESLVDAFMEIHQVFLRRLDRGEKGFLRSVGISELAKVLRGWILLYKRTLSLLRHQFPRLPATRDMIIAGFNWSETLKISAGGLLLIDHSSRYAEFWAERSIKTKDGYCSLSSRLAFVGSWAYNEYAQMVRKGDLLVLDGFSNGVTSYDMMILIKGINYSVEDFLYEIKKRDWRLERGDEKAIERLLKIYSDMNVTPRVYEL